jgi:DNA repair protein RadD
MKEAPKHEATADAERPIMSTGRPAWLPVEDVRFFRHIKAGSPTSLRVEYTSGITIYRSWICFEHQGFARSKAHGWWKRLGGASPPPETVDEAIARKGELDLPDEIQVRPAGKYFEVVSLRHVRVAA